MMQRGSFQPQTLDVDENILERNLRILGGLGGAAEDETVKALFGDQMTSAKAQQQQQKRTLLPEQDIPSIQVTPEPGICIKTKNVAGKKVFINLCKIQEIPPAPPITERELKEVISSDDYTSDFRVPMSLGSPRSETDKSGVTCLSADVAINSAWFEDTMENSLVFTTFVVNVAMEGLCEKYGDEVNLDRQNWTILRNKKYMGRLQRHHIQQRAKGTKITEVLGGDDDARPRKPQQLITEVEKTFLGPTSKLLAKMMTPTTTKHETIRSSSPREVLPNYKLIKEPRSADCPDLLWAEIDLPGVRSQRELTLDIGEDRIVLEARKAGYLLDVFVPFLIDQSKCSAQLDVDSRKLRITMPVQK